MTQLLELTCGRCGEVGWTAPPAEPLMEAVLLNRCPECGAQGSGTRTGRLVALADAPVEAREWFG